MPIGYCARLLGKSGLKLKFNIDIHHGLIDTDYRDEIGVIMFNRSDKPFLVEKYMRIA